MFCFVCHAEISQTRVLHLALCVSSESFQWVVGVHWFGLRMFGIMMYKLLIIEPFSHRNEKKSKLRIVWEFGCVLRVIRKLSLSLDLFKFISQFSELRCGKYWFFGGFCCWKFKQIIKNWVWKGKISWSCSHLCQWHMLTLVGIMFAWYRQQPVQYLLKNVVVVPLSQQCLYSSSEFHPGHGMSTNKLHIYLLYTHKVIVLVNQYWEGVE